MTGRAISGATVVAGVVGAPITQSLSPLIHNAWLATARHDGVYVPFSPDPARFESFVDGLRGGVLTGLNVTIPFKQRALALSDRADGAAAAAGAANLLLFGGDGSIEARNTDGLGLLAAFAEQAPAWRPQAGSAVVVGAGGAARGAVAALVEAGATVKVVNRTAERARDLSEAFDRVTAYGLEELSSAVGDAAVLINAAPLDTDAVAVVVERLRELPSSAVVMDMVYTPVETTLLKCAKARGLTTVDGLAMLIGQARPSFEALFGVVPPPELDVRDLVIRTLRRS
jgi:shikimate dehydrogenase